LEKNRKADMVLEGLSMGLEPRDRGLLCELVLGVLRRFFSLEADFSRFLKQKPEAEARMTLLIGTYQLRYMRVPTHAAVSECVNVMKAIQPHASGMINAVLRKVADSEMPSKLKPYQRAELPKWIYAEWRDAWGAELVQEFCEVMQTAPPLCVAVLGDRDAWLAQVEAMDIEADIGEHSPYAVLLATSTNVSGLPGFAEGAFTVMDQAAQMAVMALDAPKEGVILDICAAPGGKTALLAHRFPDADIIAIELNARRIPRLQENLQRLGVQHAQVLQANGLNLPMMDGSVDAIFLDAPCTASGIFRRHPDAKFIHDKQAVLNITMIQKVLLQESLRVLKNNAPMVYAVCSIHPDENDAIVSSIAADYLPHRLYPSASHDGFFWANIHKNKM